MNAMRPPIVTPSGDDLARPSAPWTIRRWRFAVASLLLVLAAAYGLFRALQEPSLGWRFSQAPDGSVQAVPTRAGGVALNGVRALQPAAGGAMAPVPLSSLDVIESTGIHNDYADHNRFFESHRHIWALLQAGPVLVVHSGGTTTMQPRARGLDELGMRFWFPWVVALLSLSVGLLLWVYRPRDFAARCFLVSSAGYAFGMLSTAAWGSRLLTQEPTWWAPLHVASHAGSFMVGGALCALFWRLPTRLGGNWLPGAVAAFATAAVLADGFQWLPTISLAFRIPVLLVNYVMALLFYLQWRAAKGDPVKRAQLKWVGLLLFMGLSTVFVAYSYGATGAVINLPQNYGLATVALLFVGLVPLVSRVGLFHLEGWWIRAWLWFLGGILVVALDIALITLLSVQPTTAILLASAVAGWIYFPLRQGLWRWLARDQGPKPQDVLPEIVALVALAGGSASASRKTWLQLWERVYSPEKIETLNGPQALPALQSPGATERVAAVEAAEKVEVRDQGRQLWLPGFAALPALCITLPDRGQRLFRPDDARRAREIVRLVQTGLGAQQAYQEGARQERQRIASDLHDDLGATLLTIAQQGPGSRTAELARQAMAELRLSVRGLTGISSPLSDLMADWRAESVARLTASGIEPLWQVTQGGDGINVAASMRTQVTRILREAVSNVIKHSQATRCSISLAEKDGVLYLEIADNGKGFKVVAEPADGLGLPGMERRARKLGGSFSVGPAPGGGTQLRLVLPLPSDASANIGIT